MKQSQRIVKNAAFGIGGSIIGSLVYLATVLTIAHSVSVREFGKYSFVLALAMFVSNVADCGLPRMLIREVAKDHEGFVPVAGATFSLIWVISGAMCLLVCLLVPFLRLDTDIKIAAIIMSVATLANFHSSGYGAILRAFEDYELDRLGFVLHKLFLFGAIFLSIKLRLNLVGFVTAHLFANLFVWKYSQVLVARFYARIPLDFNVPLWKQLIVSSLPLGAGAMLRSLSLQLDILVLSWLTNLTTVGLFSGPYRISVALRIVPQTLALPLYPLFSRTAHLSPGHFAEVYRLSVKFFLLISVPVAAFFAAWSGLILRTALGSKYRAAIPAMQLLGIGLVPFFVSPLFQYLFAALDQQRRFFVSTCVSATLRLVLLVVLIPMFGFVGPALAFLCAETAIVIIWTVQLSRLGYPARLFELVWRLLVAGGCMCLVLYFTHSSNLFVRSGMAAVALAVYILVLIVLRTFSSEELCHAREGIGFISPFIESWSKKLRRTNG
jgi:O-antigen/teichoic acid export membrane protein